MTISAAATRQVYWPSMPQEGKLHLTALLSTFWEPRLGLHL